jgi:hypothetical protein
VPFAASATDSGIAVLLIDTPPATFADAGDGYAHRVSVRRDLGSDPMNAIRPLAPRERWADIARANGRVAHATMQFHHIAHPHGAASGDPDRVPGLGALPVQERELLIELLAGATTTPEWCWFCVWEGWGGVDDQGVAARVELPNRKYLLHAGPISAALAVPPQSPDGVAFSTAVASGQPQDAPLTREEKVRWLE